MFLADSTIPDTSITVGVSVGLIEDTTVIGSSRPVNGTGSEIEHMMPLEKNNLTSKNNIKEKSHSYANERLIALEKKLIGTKPKLKAGSGGNGNNPPLPNNPTEDYCFPGPYKTTSNTNASLVVEGDECCEEIVVCNNPPIQQFDDPDVGVIESLGLNSPWNWIDLTGNSKNTDAGEGCNEGNPSEDVGLTYIMKEIGPYSSITPDVVYNLSEDIVVETCLDERETDSKWRFKVKNVRVPIFNDVCNTFISNRNLIDLGDGTNLSLLFTNIRNCLELKQALSDIDWQVRGPYSHPCESHPVRYVFSEGIRIHEERHYNDIIDEVKEELRDISFSELFNIYLEKITYTCPEDALNQKDLTGKSKSQQIREWLFAPRIESGANIKKQKGISSVYCPFFPFFYLQYNTEIDADNAATQTYQEIRERILTWGKAQSWYSPTKLDCLGIN